MPPPRKIDMLPEELRKWLQEELRDRGFSGYLDLTEALNFRLEQAGLEVRIGKSAVHSFGQEYEMMAKAQEEASAWAVSWMQDEGLEDEAKRHNVLFQMITALAFKVMKSQMLKEGDEIDPKELHFLGRMLKDVMHSSGIREQLTAAERKRLAEEAREAERTALAQRLDAASAEGGSEAAAAAAARRILGFGT
ncbi:phage protein Gp27 family protein [Oceaniglobus trochenteri]|uniref:phage protein Gp27 family protein n=1 Tax=Oceaniglobus trochenteri TaxID=2763260 RepID=UPI001CFF8EA2|nr:phage protein Gp27 family protein [Oceaniglobus trochenteri]